MSWWIALIVAVAYGICTYIIGLVIIAIHAYALHTVNHGGVTNPMKYHFLNMAVVFILSPIFVPRWVAEFIKENRKLI
jgi:hypothetical protein